MTTRALEDSEIKAIFENVSGVHAKRNETLLITGIRLALRASELVGLKVADVYEGSSIPLHRPNKKVKSYVTIRPETAKFGKERTIRIGDGIQQTISDFLSWNWVYLIPLVAIVIGIGIPLSVIICHYLLKMKRAEIIRAAIEKGEEIPNEVLALLENEKSEETRKHEKEMALIEQGLYEQHQRNRSLKSGIVLSSLGVAFTIFSIVVLRSEYFLNADAVGFFLLAGLILLFLGAGLIVCHYLTLRERKHNSVDDNPIS